MRIFEIEMAPVTKKPKTDEAQSGEEHPSVTLFREYLRIKSVHPEPDYEGCNAFLKTQAEEMGLPYYITEMSPGTILQP